MANASHVKDTPTELVVFSSRRLYVSQIRENLDCLAGDGRRNEATNFVFVLSECKRYRVTQNVHFYFQYLLQCSRAPCAYLVDR